MKSICFFTYDLTFGGAEKVVVHLANYFALKGMEVTLLTVSKGNDFKKLINPQINLICLNEHKIVNAIPPLIKFVKTNNIDNFVANIWPLTIVSSCIRLVSKKTKLLFIEHCNLSEEFRNRSFIFRFAQNTSIMLFYSFAHEVIAVSAGVKEDLEKKGVKKSKVSVIYNPLEDLKGSKKMESTKNIEKWINSKDKKLISVGELKKQKNFPNLIKAIGVFQKKYSVKLKLLILGDGPERKNIEEEITKQELEEIFFLPGWVNDPVPYLYLADLFVLPSDYEGFGVVITEALSTGLNVVSTNCKSGPSEILKDGELGYLCEVNDPDDLAKSINEALNNPLDKDKLIARAYDFSIENIGKLYEEKLNF